MTVVQLVASIAVQSLFTERSSTVWRELSRLSAVCKEEDRGTFRSRFPFLARAPWRSHLCVSYAAYYAYVDLRRCALVMKTTLMAHFSLGPYKGSVKSVHIQMPFQAVGRSFRPSGGSYAPGITNNFFNIHVCR